MSKFGDIGILSGMKPLFLVSLITQILDQASWHALTLKGVGTSLGMLGWSTHTNKHLDLSHTGVKLCLILWSDSCYSPPIISPHPGLLKCLKDIELQQARCVHWLVLGFRKYIAMCGFCCCCFCNMLQGNQMEMTNNFMIVHGGGLQISVAILSHFEVTLLPRSRQRAFSECLNCSLLLIGGNAVTGWIITWIVMCLVSSKALLQPLSRHFSCIQLIDL